MPPKKDPVFEYIDTLIVDHTRLDQIVHDLSGLVDNIQSNCDHMFSMMNSLQTRLEQLEFTVVEHASLPPRHAAGYAQSEELP